MEGLNRCMRPSTLANVKPLAAGVNHTSDLSPGEQMRKFPRRKIVFRENGSEFIFRQKRPFSREALKLDLNWEATSKGASHDVQTRRSCCLESGIELLS